MKLGERREKIQPDRIRRDGEQPDKMGGGLNKTEKVIGREMKRQNSTRESRGRKRQNSIKQRKANGQNQTKLPFLVSVTNIF